MATDPALRIDIASVFTGKKAFKQADTATEKLIKNTKKLAGVLGVAYGTRAIVQYGKASMAAAAQDQKAQKILTNNLKNIGLAYASVDAESFIQSMEKQTAILDDNLRPAYSQLAQVTGSVTKTQDLMGLAFDVSSGSGLDYASTVDILSQAYVGNNKGLKQLNLGLTQAELKAMSFDEIQTKLRQNFAGAGGIALNTYAGSMARLGVATSNASETIGTALLDAVIKVSGSQGVDGLITKIDMLATGIASVVTQIGNMVAALNGTEAQKAFSPGFMVSGGRAGSFRVGPTGAGNMAMSVQSQDLQKSALAAQKKAELDAIKRNKELAKLAKDQAAAALATAKAKKDQAALDKAALALAKGVDVFDMDKIQINAAILSSTQALGKATSQTQLLSIANDLARLTIKQDMLVLEDAIAAKDVQAATAAAKKLNTDIAILGTLSNQSLKLANIKTILESILPKSLIDLANLDAAIEKIKQMNALQGTKTLVPANTPNAVIPTVITPTVTPTATAAPGGKLGTITQAETTILLQTALGTDALFEYWEAATAAANAAADLLDYQNAQNEAAFKNSSLFNAAPTVNISAGVIASPDEFARMVQKAVQNANRFGNNLDYAGGL